MAGGEGVAFDCMLAALVSRIPEGAGTELSRIRRGAVVSCRGAVAEPSRRHRGAVAEPSRIRIPAPNEEWTGVRFLEIL